MTVDQPAISPKESVWLTRGYWWMNFRSGTSGIPWRSRTARASSGSLVQI